MQYKSNRIIDRKPKWVIINENGEIINNNPSKEELKGLEKEPYFVQRKKQYSNEELLRHLKRFYEENGRVPQRRDFINNPDYPGFYIYFKRFGSWDNAIIKAELWDKYYNETNSCDRCGRSFEEIDILGKTPLKEYNEKGDWTGRWDCKSCYEKYDPSSYTNIKKTMRDRRTNNLDPNSSHAKGDKSQELVCELYGWEDLNKKNNNYTSPIDCCDPKTGLYYQVRGKWYDPINKRWDFPKLEKEWQKEYEYMVCYCISEYGNIIEEIYKFPSWVIIGIKAISIYKDHNLWYEEYRVKDQDELMRANDIWTRLNIKNK